MKFSGILLITLATLTGIGTHMALNYTNRPVAEEQKSVKDYTPDIVAADGVVEGAQPEIVLRPEITGTIKAIHFRENQEVTKGSLLVELVNDTHKHQVKLAQAQLAVTEAQLERLINGERPQRRRALAALERSRKAIYENAKANWERSQKMFKAVSPEQRDLDYFRMLKAQADLQEASAERALAEAPARVDEVAAAKARVEVAKANIQLAQAELAKTRLLAPTSGQVLTVVAEPGEFTGPSKAVLVMADLSRRRIRAFIEELDAFRVKEGQKAVVTVDGLPGREFPGTVAKVMTRMGKRSLFTDSPREYKDVYFREVLIDVPTDNDLVPNARVKTRITVKGPQKDRAPAAKDRYRG